MITMTLHPSGREFLSYPVVENPDLGDLEISFDEGDTWANLTVVEGQARVLIAGPDAAGSGAVVLAAGIYYPLVRGVAAPELLVRPGGRVRVGQFRR